MIGKFVAKTVDDIPRTYLVRDRNGREFFKMYKPSETKEIFRKKCWTGRIVSILSGAKVKRK